MKLRFTVSGIEDCLNALSNKAARVDTGLGSATRQATALIVDQVSRRILIPKRINVQDAMGRNYARFLSQRKPVSSFVDTAKKEGLVVVGEHYTNVRTSGLIRQWTSHGGQATDLLRTGLRIPRNSFIKGANGKFQGRSKSNNRENSQAGLQTMSFQKWPKLLQWAQQRGRGYQVMRHAIKLTPEVGQALITQPAVARNRERIHQFYRDAVIKGWLS